MLPLCTIFTCLRQITILKVCYVSLYVCSKYICIYVSNIDILQVSSTCHSFSSLTDKYDISLGASEELKILEHFWITLTPLKRKIKHTTTSTMEPKRSSKSTLITLHLEKCVLFALLICWT